MTGASPATAPVLELSGLRKSFGALAVTDDVSLDLHPGECHALIGPNGAGKTTLIHQISGHLAPDAGTVRLAGEDVTALPMHARARRGLARSFQITSVVPSMSAADNVALAVQGRERGRKGGGWWSRAADPALEGAAMEALDRVGLAPRARVPAADLSHGERRSLELAIAIAMRPRAMLLDEPMAGMGREESAALVGTLRALIPECPMLLVEHDMDAVFALATRVSVLEYGRLIATGPPAAIRDDPAVRAAYLGEDEDDDLDVDEEAA